jgi:KaiC/GvpD/RAD55 family RecA-like ATPase
MRIKTGITGLDGLMEGGLLPNHVYMISGAPGSGRTTFGIQFLVRGAADGEKGLYVAFTQSPTSIIKNISRFDLKLVDFVRAKRIYFMAAGQELFGEEGKSTKTESEDIFDLSSPSTPLKSILDKIESIIKKTDIKRLVIDSSAYLPFLLKGREDEKKQVGKIIHTLKSWGVTILLLAENDKPSDFQLEHYLVDGIIFLHYNHQIRNKLDTKNTQEHSRGIQLLKIRGTKHDNKFHPIRFTNLGLKIFE